MNPLISILLPNLNNRPYLPARIDSIFNQTLEDWELIIVDNYSDDGAWELFKELAAKDSRVKLSQAPRKGMYANWNNCLRQATGRYVYIATSDDTMTPDCLEEMVEALENNPNCGACHCALQIIDEQGSPVASEESWENWTQQKYFGDWIGIPHVRQAPHDGLLHFGFCTVYTSITQLLIRRSVFEQLGLFRTDCHSYADFEWGMRIGLNENIVHIPQKLATWRRHTLQATQSNEILRIRAQGEFHRMVGEALKSLNERDPQLAKALRHSRLNRFYLANELGARRAADGSLLRKFGRIIAFGLKHPLFCLRWLFCKIVLRKGVTGEFASAVRTEFTKLGFKDLLRPLKTDDVEFQQATVANVASR